MIQKKPAQGLVKFSNSKKGIVRLLHFVRNENRVLRSFVVILLLSFFLSCSTDERNQTSVNQHQIELPSDGIEISNVWARPGPEGGTSAIYMNILNGTSQADTLVSISFPVAGMAEVHESYEQEEGMMGMRPVETIIVPAQDVLSLEPGGLHVMLMQLNRPLAEGDSVEFTVEFATAGEMNFTVPVQLINR